jgi:hypothetical protein
MHQKPKKLLKIVLSNNDVDASFKLLIDRVKFVDTRFKFDKVELPVKEFIIFNNDIDA